MTATLPRPAGLASLPGVVLLTDWTPADAAALSRSARAGAEWLVPVRIDGGLVLIGPALGPAAACCLGCAETTRLRVLASAAGGASFGDVDGLRLGGRVPAVAAALLDAVVRAVAGDPAGHDGILVAVRADHGTVSTHRVRPVPRGCDVCAPVPADAPAALDLASAPTADPAGLRVGNPRLTADRLRALLFDWRHGPVVRVARSERTPLPMAAAEIAGDGPVTEAGYGRAASFAEAERVALFEAVERYTGGRPHARRTVVEASFEELGPDRAVDPDRLGLPDRTPYTPRTTTRWVYGWSVPGRRPVAVPEHVAYWDLPQSGRFLHETSSGCGLGTGLVEAVLYGLFEVAERDAFLMAWYARTPLTRVRPPAGDAILPHLVDRLESVGYDLLLFDATNDVGVPAVLALALAGQRAAARGAPRAYFAAGAHPDPVRAMRSAAVEAAANVFSVPEQARAKPELLARDRLLPMLDDPALVRTMSDHVTLYTLPEAAGRYEFLLGGAAPATDWRDVWPGRPAPVDDLAGLLATTAERLAERGLEVITVDQSDPVVRERSGLCSAKVVVPGTLPMTFGHRNRRTAGLPRLVDVPHRLGRLPASIRYEDLPLHPHPFP